MIDIRFGWIPDLPDIRDYKYDHSHRPDPSVFPASCDITERSPRTHHQFASKACSAGSVALLFHFDAIKQRGKYWATDPSRFFIYYHVRMMHACEDVDTGSSLRDCFKAIVKYGLCAEKSWPSIATRINRHPSQRAYESCLKHKSIKYYSVGQNLHAIKSCLLDGYPIAMGICAYEGFLAPEVETTGVIPMPQPNERLLGGHTIVLMGYDDTNGMFRFRNTLGSTWGQLGDGYIAYDYVTNPLLAGSLWTLRTEEP